MRLVKITEERYVVMDGTAITHSTQPLEMSLDTLDPVYDKIKPLSLQEVRELVDVAEIAYLKQLALDNQDKNWIGYGKGIGGVSKQRWRQIYNQALEDNKEKKYTEEDIRRAFMRGCASERNLTRRIDELEDYIRSLQLPSYWKVKFVDGKLKLI